jgi:hypothetical protein
VDGDGNGRVVYPRDSERRICAADDTYATQAEVQAVADDLCGAVDAIEARLEALENAQRTAPPAPLAVPWGALMYAMFPPIPHSAGPMAESVNAVRAWIIASLPQEARNASQQKPPAA